MDTQTVSIEQTQNVHVGDLLGRRIKFLRGELSQHEFAKKVGVSRSALANYETGRTVPSPEVVRKICDHYEISEDFLERGVVADVSEFATSLGLRSHQGDGPTKDEWAFIRVLRLCNTETVLKVVTSLTEGFIADEQSKRLADPVVIVEDLARLISIIDQGGRHERGLTRGNVEQVIVELSKRLEALKKGPQ